MEQQIATGLPNITAGLVNEAQVASELGCSKRSVRRYEDAGMPVIRLGFLRLYDPAKVREWLMTHERGHHVPKRGRPSKSGSR